MRFLPPVSGCWIVSTSMHSEPGNAIESNGTYKVSNKRKSLKPAKIKQHEAQRLPNNAATQYFIAASQCTADMEPTQALVVRLSPAPYERNQCGIGLLCQ